MNDNSAITVQNLTKTFKLPHEKVSSVKSALIGFGKRKKGYEKQQVLTNISFSVQKGDFVGIIGRNGSGKSTLLKLLAGIYAPDSGNIIVNGKLTPFIELGVGFNPELSGRDNVFLNGALLGFSRSEVQLMYDEIVEFAELDRFMDQKLKNYSSGMQVRLAFSIAIRANTDVLILDEVLAVGDEAFQRKCYDYFNELKQRGKTVILVTHDMGAVERFCNRAIVLDKGKIIFDGKTTEGSTVYRNLNLTSTQQAILTKNKRRSAVQAKKTEAIITEFYTTNDENKDTVLFGPQQSVTVHCTVQANTTLEHPEFLIKFNNPGGTIISAFEKLLVEPGKEVKAGQTAHVTWTIPGIYNDGKYILTASLKNQQSGVVYVDPEASYEFDIQGWTMPDVLIHPSDKHTITITK